MGKILCSGEVTTLLLSSAITERCMQIYRVNSFILVPSKMAGTKSPKN